MPLDIIESILDIRQKTIDNRLWIPYDRVSKYDNPIETICHCSYGRAKECDAIIFDSILLGLQMSGLWPEKHATEVKLSVDDIASKLNAIHIHGVQDRCSCSCHDTWTTNPSHELAPLLQT